ncbi:MAG: glycosyltransferase [bacterium]
MIQALRGYIPESIEEIVRDIRVSFLDMPVRNFFRTNYPRHVLISYITSPFRKGISLSHTNTRESVEIARVFHNLGFTVDIVNYQYRGGLDYSPYDFIFGFGEPLIKSFYRRNRHQLTVFYGTGMHVCHQNHATLQRIAEVYRKKGEWLLESGRIVDKSWTVQTTLVDAIITLGNETVADSYRPYFHKKIYCLPVTYYQVLDFEDVLAGKDFRQAQKHVLWFGSSGLVHKGLDVLLEVFKELTDRHLHICGPIDREPGFKKCYYQELYCTENIHTYGFVNLQSELFKHLVSRCGFVIFPSCSEGEPSAVINVMANAGLIPIVTRESGITVDSFGIRIHDISGESIKRSLAEAMALGPSELQDRSFACARKTVMDHSVERFRSTLTDALKSVIEEDGLTLPV